MTTGGIRVPAFCLQRKRLTYKQNLWYNKHCKWEAPLGDPCHTGRQEKPWWRFYTLSYKLREVPTCLLSHDVPTISSCRLARRCRPHVQ